MLVWIPVRDLNGENNRKRWNSKESHIQKFSVRLLRNIVIYYIWSSPLYRHSFTESLGMSPPWKDALQWDRTWHTYCTCTTHGKQSVLRGKYGGNMITHTHEIVSIVSVDKVQIAGIVATGVYCTHWQDRSALRHTGSSVAYKTCNPIATNNQKSFAASNSASQNFLFTELCWRSCWSLCCFEYGVFSKSKMRLTADPEGTFVRCQDLLKALHSLLKSQGAGYFLWPCGKHQTL